MPTDTPRGRIRTNRRVERALARQRQRRRRRVLAVVAGVGIALAGVGVGLVVMGWLAGDEDRPGAFRRDGSELVSEQGAPLGFVAVPQAYRIVYRDESAEPGGWRETTEQRIVLRPFDSRAITRQAPDSDAEPGGQRTSFGRLTTGGEDGLRVVLGAQPSVAGSDLRPDVTIEDAVAQGMAERVERRRVLGRECQVYRLAGPLSTGDLVPLGDEGRERAEGCIDAQGFLLEELWWIDEQPVRRRLAIELELDPSIDADTDFARGREPSLTVAEGSGSARAVDPESRPEGTFFELARPIAGFRLDGRYAVVWAQLGAGPADASSGGDRVGTVVDVWLRGPDVVLFERGGTSQRSLPFEPHPHGQPLDVGDLGEAEIIYGLRGNEVRILRPGGEFIKVVATVAVADLLKIVDTIEQVDGGRGLVDLR